MGSTLSLVGDFEIISLIKKAQQALLDVFDADYGVINLVREAGSADGLSPGKGFSPRKASKGMDGYELWNPLPQTISPLTSAVAKHVVETGEVVNVGDIKTDMKFSNCIDPKTGSRVRSILVVPVLDSDGNVIGVLELASKHKDGFTGNSFNLLIHFSTFFGMSLERCRNAEERMENAVRDMKNECTNDFKKRAMELTSALKEAQDNVNETINSAVQQTLNNEREESQKKIDTLLDEISKLQNYITAEEKRALDAEVYEKQLENSVQELKNISIIATSTQEKLQESNEELLNYKKKCDSLENHHSSLKRYLSCIEILVRSNLLSSRSLYETSISAACEMIDADMGQMYIVEHSSPILKLHDNGRLIETSFKLGEGVLGKVLKSSKSLLIKNTKTSGLSDLIFSRGIARQPTSLIAIPLVNEQIGVNALFVVCKTRTLRDEGDGFVQEDENLLNKFCDIVTALMATAAQALKYKNLKKEELQKSVEAGFILKQAIEDQNKSIIESNNIVVSKISHVIDAIVTIGRVEDLHSLYSTTGNFISALVEGDGGILYLFKNRELFSCSTDGEMMKIPSDNPANQVLMSGNSLVKPLNENVEVLFVPIFADPTLTGSNTSSSSTMSTNRKLKEANVVGVLQVSLRRKGVSGKHNVSTSPKFNLTPEFILEIIGKTVAAQLLQLYRIEENKNLLKAAETRTVAGMSECSERKRDYS